MTRRSRAREVALQLLFQRDHNLHVDEAFVQRFLQDRLRDPELLKFCRQLYEGTVANLASIDELLTAAADNWRLSRMATVDRNVLRLGVFEMLYFGETPAPVALDEAIVAARRFGSADSASFVNGVLDRINQAAKGPA